MDIYSRIGNEYIDLFYCYSLANKRQIEMLEKESSPRVRSLIFFLSK